MNALAPFRPDRARDLLAENEELRERVRQLEEALVPRVTFPAAWDLTNFETKFLAALLAAAPGWCSRDRAYTALYGDRAEPVAESSLGVWLHRIRTKLAAAEAGIVIEGRLSIGWRVEPGSLPLLRTAAGRP